jgi:transcriptional regulator GlxA family with amidase domain
MDANLENPVTIVDLATASGVGARTLFRRFREHYGMAPMAYLRKLRLDAAHRELCDGDPDRSVTEIAMRFCFEHLGRFATAYREKFGEPPSATLQGRRSRYGSFTNQS